MHVCESPRSGGKDAVDGTMPTNTKFPPPRMWVKRHSYIPFTFCFNETVSLKSVLEYPKTKLY